MNKRSLKKMVLMVVFVFLLNSFLTFAASPSGDDTFELLANPYTGGDNTGDGGTGNASDLNYFYVGQVFTATMRIISASTNGADLWVDYDASFFDASSLTTGSFYDNWTGQDISGGRVKSSSYNNPGTYSSGIGNFGTVDFEMLRPSEASYGITTPQTLDINVGVIGDTTESNISLDGVDELDDEEDFVLHIWADTVKPFAENELPLDAAIDVLIDDNYTFDLRDTLNGEGDNLGVGTGVNLATPPGVITFDDGGGAVDYTAYDSYACSGVWGTNLCEATVNPLSPLGIVGDTRNWKYDTLYTVVVDGFQDLASPAQDQLGDANGPNAMDTKTWTFRTEADIVAPQVTSETPSRGSIGVAVDTNVVVEITDRKVYPNGPSGTGVDSSTCDIAISSPSFALTSFAEGDGGVTVTAIDYGYRFEIDPASDFAQNELVTVAVSNCEDLASVPNVMAIDTYTFTTTDSDAPYVDTLVPSDDANINTDDTISFHVKDDGVGVDLSEVVVYLNGNYYTNGGGAGSVTVNGTRITFADSFDFNGGNYAGDTTSIAGGNNDLTFVIDQEVDFVDGEVVPLIVYAADNSGNLMERSVFAFSVGATVCSSGSTYCGDNTSWNGLLCVGTGGGSSGGGGGGGSTIIWSSSRKEIDNQSVVQVDESSVLVTWTSTVKGDSTVLYDTVSSSFDNYSNYRLSNDIDVVYHSVLIEGLNSGTVYYFRPKTVTEDGKVVRGEEMQMTPKFRETVYEKEIVYEECVPQQIEVPVYQEVQSYSTPQTVYTHSASKKSVLEIDRVERNGGIINVWGKAEPFANIEVTIY